MRNINFSRRKLRAHEIHRLIVIIQSAINGKEKEWYIEENV
jgi:hypothetical protein